jgi:hypothetical protein
MKEFINARAAAELLGVSQHVVVTDVEEGNRTGRLHHLNGGLYGATVVIYAYELDGDRLAFHRERLSRTVSGSAAFKDSGRSRKVNKDQK